jgi:hypothetical protein
MIANMGQLAHFVGRNPNPNLDETPKSTQSSWLLNEVKKYRDGGSMTFNIDESLVLLRAIFPRYPGLQEQKPAPDLETFLSSLRTDGAMGPTKSYTSEAQRR